MIRRWQRLSLGWWRTILRQQRRISPCQVVRTTCQLEFALRGTWIPPKNVPAYDGVCDMMKLSCRMHPDPKKIFDAYCLGADCDILDVLGERLVPTDGVRLVQS